MNMSAFERAQVAAFAYKAARHTGSLDCMKAVCYVLRNRVRAGWGDVTWLGVMEGHHKVAGNEDDFWPTMAAKLDVQDRLLQMLVRDVDDIYTGISEDDTKRVVQDALFYQFIDRPGTEWFKENIVRQSETHPRIAQVGPIALFR
jgi:hypothetical protein